MPLTVGSLFAGIGGFDLGLERAGMRVRWQVDNEPFAQHILNKHWPDVPCYSDIRDVRGEEVEPVDILCGGFPCQDISAAGRGDGIEGARSGLWSEYARLVGELRPRYVIVENVAVLRKRGLDRVLGDLSLLGYDAEWDRIRASDIGAPHQRARLWLVAYPSSEPVWQQSRGSGGQGRSSEALTGLDGEACGVAYPDGRGLEPCVGDLHARELNPVGRGAALADANDLGWDGRPRIFGPAGWTESAHSRGPWPVEPDVGRVAHGVPARVDRLRGLGNALVPQIAQWIGERILAYEGLRPSDDTEVRLTVA